MLEFHAEGWFHIDNRGWCAATRLDRDTSDFDYLIGATVAIDGSRYSVIGVERRSQGPPWRKNEPISLLVDGAPPAT